MGFAVGGVEIMEIASNYVAGLEPATPSSFTTKNYVDQNLALLNANTDAGGQILQDQINATNTAVANLQSQLDTANANITAQGNAIAALQTRCSNLEARMTAAEGRLGTHDSQITDLYNTKASLNANVRFNSVVANQDIVAYS
jgi:chromosome segregation ATPase